MKKIWFLFPLATITYSIYKYFHPKLKQVDDNICNCGFCIPLEYDDEEYDDTETFETILKNYEPDIDSILEDKRYKDL